VEKVDAEPVREITGFSIGGVPPVGLKSALEIFLDRDLLRYDKIWAAAGTPKSLFSIAPTNLVRITGAVVADVAEAPRGQV
jgi:prolyl-tRNA editing enzyme YbaK/EbsC (Cys-tRNA(Pro) deacylase)